MKLCGKKVIVNLEARLLLRPTVSSADIREKIEFQSGGNL